MATHQIEIKDVASECNYARYLIGKGEAARDDRLEFLRNGELCLSGAVGWFADRTVRENANQPPVFVKWRPFPDVRRPPETASDASEVE